MTSEDESAGNPLDRIFSRVDAFQRRHALLAFPMAVLKKFGDDRGTRLAALVAYYGFFSLFPLLLILVTAVGFVLSWNQDLQRDVINAVVRQFPVLSEEIHENIGSLRGSGAGLAIGFGGLLWAGMGVMASLQDAMNTVWAVPIKWRPNFFEKRGRALLTLLLLGAGFTAAAALAGFSILGSLGNLAAGGLLISFLIEFALFLLAFRILTDRALAWEALVPGALLGAAGWVALQSLGGLFVQRAVSGASPTYGFFAVVIGLLSWMYLLAQWVILTAEVNVVRHERLWPRTFFGNELREPADRRALERYALVEERRAEQVVEVSFRNDGQDGQRPRTGLGGTAARLPHHGSLGGRR